jgi:hypothetical protein
MWKGEFLMGDVQFVRILLRSAGALVVRDGKFTADLEAERITGRRFLLLQVKKDRDRESCEWKQKS